jgi:AraC-like DNA-binding protein
MKTTQQHGLHALHQKPFEPLVALLEQELAVAGITHPRPAESSLVEFTLYYLEVIQLLEAQVAGDHEREPILRSEVEILCRNALSASTLAEAIELCRRFCVMLYPRAGHIDLRVRGETATFSLDSLRPETSTTSSLLDITGLFAFRQLFQWLVGVDLPLRKVGIGSIRRDDVMAFLPLFRAPVLAGGRRFTLVFGRGALDLPVVRGRDEFPKFFEVFPCGVFEITANTLTQQISALLTAAARQSAGIPTQRELASSLDIPYSTFRRRLSGQGVSFRALRDACLRDVSFELLNRDDLLINEAAAQLGFGDTAAFRRAFKRWTGESPRAWRERNSSV